MNRQQTYNKGLFIIKEQMLQIADVMGLPSIALKTQLKVLFRVPDEATSPYIKFTLTQQFYSSKEYVNFIVHVTV